MALLLNHFFFHFAFGGAQGLSYHSLILGNDGRVSHTWQCSGDRAVSEIKLGLLVRITYFPGYKANSSPLEQDVRLKTISVDSVHQPNFDYFQK